jgi:hypothetical protein
MERVPPSALILSLAHFLIGQVVKLAGVAVPFRQKGDAAFARSAAFPSGEGRYGLCQGRYPARLQAGGERGEEGPLVTGGLLCTSPVLEGVPGLSVDLGAGAAIGGLGRRVQRRIELWTDP